MKSFIFFLLSIAFASEVELKFNSISEWRTLDGSKNNAKYPSRGSITKRQILRLFPPNFEAQVEPNARILSNTLSESKADAEVSGALSQMALALGFLINRDIIKLNGRFDSSITVPLCDNVYDPGCVGGKSVTYSSFNVEDHTMENCESAWLDLSSLYQEGEFREFQDGRLNLTIDGLFPVRGILHGCPIGGPDKSNESPLFYAFTTLWAREHNRIAALLLDRHPDWSDEQLFFEARERVIALYQKTIYEEYLPALIGRAFDRPPYDEELDPTVSNIFTNAAWKLYGHSAYPESLDIASSDWKITSSISQGEAIYRGHCYVDMFDDILRGAMIQKERSIDGVYTGILRGNGKHCECIVSDIENARTSKLPRFNAVREYFGLPPVSIDDFNIEDERKKHLRTIYGNEDVDLLVGLSSEPQEEGSLMGPTMEAIIYEQFDRLKRSDRLFYTHNAILLDWVEGDSFADLIERNTGIENITIMGSPLIAFEIENQESCSSSSSSSNYLEPLSGMSLRWSVEDEIMIINLSSTFSSSVGYMAIGWNEKTAHPMDGADIMYFFIDDVEIGWSEDIGQFYPMADLKRKADTDNCKGSLHRHVDRVELKDGVLYADFTRSTQAGGCDVCILNKEMITIFARSTDLRSYHGHSSRVSFLMNWHAGSAEKVRDDMFYIRLAHGVTMIGMFLLLYPLAVSASRYLKNYPLESLPFGMSWISIHVSFATIGIFTTLSMAMTAISTKWSDGGTSHNKSTHGMFGLAICWLVLSQWLVGNMIVTSHTFDLGRETLFTIMSWTKFYHKISGIVIIFLSPYVIYLGNNLLLPLPDIQIAQQVWFWYIPLVIFAIVGEYFHWNKLTGTEEINRNMSKVTMEQFTKMCDNGQMLVIVNGFAVDVAAWLPIHPGGNKAIEHLMGTDITDELKSGIHSHSRTAFLNVQNMRVCEVIMRDSHNAPQISKLVFRQRLSKNDDRPVDLFIFEVSEKFQDEPFSYIKLYAVVKQTLIHRLYTPIPQEIIEKFYSPSSTSSCKVLGLIIKLYPKGMMSQYLAKRAPGDSMRFTGPHLQSGVDHERLSRIGYDPCLLLCAGTGINPMFQIVTRKIRENDIKLLWALKCKKDSYLLSYLRSYQVDYSLYFGTPCIDRKKPLFNFEAVQRRFSSVTTAPRLDTITTNALFGNDLQFFEQKIYSSGRINRGTIERGIEEMRRNFLSEDDGLGLFSPNFVISGTYCFVKGMVDILRSINIPHERIILLDYPKIKDEIQATLEVVDDAISESLRQKRSIPLA